MAMYKHLRKIMRKKTPSLTALQRQRLIAWRREPAIRRISRPTNLATARSLGYKAKHGYILARIRLLRGGRKRPRIKKGRRTARSGQKLTLHKNYQQIAEERIARRFPNLEVLNSYKAAKDGVHYWFEVILIDPQHPSIKADPKINWICSAKHRRRVHRGLTAAGKRARGILRGRKGKGREKK